MLAPVSSSYLTFMATLTPWFFRFVVRLPDTGALTSNGAACCPLSPAFCACRCCLTQAQAARVYLPSTFQPFAYTAFRLPRWTNLYTPALVLVVWCGRRPGRRFFAGAGHGLRWLAPKFCTRVRLRASIYRVPLLLCKAFISYAYSGARNSTVAPVSSSRVLRLFPFAVNDGWDGVAVRAPALPSGFAFIRRGERTPVARSSCYYHLSCLPRIAVCRTGGMLRAFSGPSTAGRRRWGRTGVPVDALPLT